MPPKPKGSAGAAGGGGGDAARVVRVAGAGGGGDAAAAAGGVLDDVSDIYDCRTTGLNTQQELTRQLNLLHQAIEENPLNQANDEARKQLFTELSALRESLSTPTFFQTIANKYSEPVKRTVIRLIAEKVKRLLRPLNRDRDDPVFDRFLIDCLMEMISVTNYYFRLLFKSFFNNSVIRLLFGAGCSIIELEMAYYTLRYILNGGLYVISGGFIGNVGDLSRLFSRAYQICSQTEIIAFLVYYGYSEQQAASIYSAIEKMSVEQRKFVLKGIFARSIRRIENKEGVGNGPAAAPAPSFTDFLHNPALFFNNLPAAIPRPKFHLLIGDPAQSMEAAAGDGIEWFAGKVDETILAQLRLAFPDKSDEILADTLFTLFLDLKGPFTKEKYDLNLYNFIQKLKKCLMGKYTMTEQQFHVFCQENYPGLNDGVTEGVIGAVYGQKVTVSDSLEALASNTPRPDPGTPGLRTKFGVGARGFIKCICDTWQTFLGGVVPEKAAPLKAIDYSKLEHPLFLLVQHIDLLKKERPESEAALDKCFEIFKRNMCIDVVDKQKVLSTGIYRDEGDDWGAACRDLYSTIGRIGTFSKDSLKTLFELFFQLGFMVCDERVELALPAPFGGNSFAAASTMGDKYVGNLAQVLATMVRQQQDVYMEKQPEASEQPDDFLTGTPIVIRHPAGGGGGGALAAPAAAALALADPALAAGGMTKKHKTTIHVVKPPPPLGDGGGGTELSLHHSPLTIHVKPPLPPAPAMGAAGAAGDAMGAAGDDGYSTRGQKRPDMGPGGNSSDDDDDGGGGGAAAADAAAADAAGDEMGAAKQGGGNLSSKKSGSKSRKNTKRTRRHSKGRKSSKAAKKTKQRRSSRHRRSSRKGRK